MPEEGAVGASEDTSLGAGAWDGGGRFSWQGGGGVDGWGPTSTRRCDGGGGGAEAWTVLGDECGTVGISAMDGLAGVQARRKRRLRDVRRPEPSTLTRY